MRKASNKPHAVATLKTGDMTPRSDWASERHFDYIGTRNALLKYLVFYRGHHNGRVDPTHHIQLALAGCLRVPEEGDIPSEAGLAFFAKVVEVHGVEYHFGVWCVLPNGLKVAATTVNSRKHAQIERGTVALEECVNGRADRRRQAHKSFSLKLRAVGAVQ
jgi:hypothetical protein